MDPHSFCASRRAAGCRCGQDCMHVNMSCLYGATCTMSCTSEMDVMTAIRKGVSESLDDEDGLLNVT